MGAGAELDRELEAIRTRLDALEIRPPEPSPEPEPQPSADVILDDMTSPTAFKDAIAAVPVSGGTLLVKPGTYTIAAGNQPWISGRASLRIVGELGPNGERPHLRGDDAARPNVMIGWGSTNGDLSIENIEISNIQGRGIYCGTGRFQPHAQIVTLRNVHIHHVAHHCVIMAWEDPEKWNDELHIEDSVFHNNGSTHNVYCDRARLCRFVRSKTYSPATLHALKIVAVELEVRDSEISNVGLDGTPDDSLHPTFMPTTKTEYFGSTPMSLVAGQRGVVRGNRIVFAWRDGVSGGHAVARQHRHAIQGMDSPPYFPAPVDVAVPEPDSSDFWRSEFWDRVRADGLGLAGVEAGNPELLPVFWSANEFVSADPRSIGIINQGTYPNEPISSGSSQVQPLPAPPGWEERSLDLLYQGTDTAEANTWTGPWAQKGESREGSFMGLNPSVRVFEVDGTFPPWFKR